MNICEEKSWFHNKYSINILEPIKMGFLLSLITFGICYFLDFIYIFNVDNNIQNNLINYGIHFIILNIIYGLILCKMGKKELEKADRKSQENFEKKINN